MFVDSPGIKTVRPHDVKEQGRKEGKGLFLVNGKQRKYL